MVAQSSARAFTPDALDFYEQYGFVSVDVVEGQSDARPAPIPMFLALRSIQEGLGPEGG